MLHLHTPGKFNKGKGDDLYIYMKIKPLNNGWRVERKAGSGRWKNLKRGEEITLGDRTIAYKTTLTYYVVKNGKEEKTCWSMHEYRLHRKNSEKQMGDELVLCKIYKRGGAGKTGEAIDEENNEETGGSIGSCSYLKSSTTVSNGFGQSFPDVHSLECFETEDLVTPTNGSCDLPMAAVNDPSQFVVSPIEDSVTPMNFYGDFPMPDVNNSFLFVGSPIEDSLLVPMNAYGISQYWLM
ncbi:NAC transcription factor 29-like protein [Cinnamomum micranthum f. kanehirae]|uniref:NAC transcription factor 29-like protein n=1 Tax=Cinnamomum micranthum f. kanehirae TaxID=337451 RepID=A0A443N1L0_9MAGN|nr:NAC transcription factor 29-like protein [Cinnamomum micranthum f. kanehirae]